MNKRTSKIAKAFVRGEKATDGNTMTDGKSVWLHGHDIVGWERPGMLCFSMCGWPTRTTRERLNGVFAEVFPVKAHRPVIYQRDGEQWIECADHLTLNKRRKFWINPSAAYYVNTATGAVRAVAGTGAA